MSTRQIALAGTTALFAVIAAAQWISAENQRQQLATYEDYVADLQTELESQGSHQVDYETQINELRRDLQASENRIAGLENELASAREQIDPDAVSLEQRIRERVALEMRQVQPQSLSRTELVKQLNSLDPMELGQLMSLQGIYGGFLQRLNVDEDRMEVLIDGLGNIMEEQNQRRFEIINQMTNNPDGVQNFRQDMLAVNGPDAQRNALSFLLTDDEMQVYDEFQEERRQNGAFATQAFTLSNTPSNRAVILNGVGSGSTDTQLGQEPGPSVIFQEQSPTIFFQEPLDN